MSTLLRVRYFLREHKKFSYILDLAIFACAGRFAKSEGYVNDPGNHVENFRRSKLFIVQNYSSGKIIRREKFSSRS